MDNTEVDLAEAFGPLIHPMKVQILEAMRCIGRPLSATELEQVFDKKTGLSSISYHLTSLKKAEVVRKVEKRPVRGAWESHYFFRGLEPATD